MDRDISYKKIGFLALAFIASTPGIFIGEYLQQSAEVLGYIVSILSILAAALFAVISIVGDPSMLLSGNRRRARQSASSLQIRLQVFNHLFTAYLITLAAIVCAGFLEHVESNFTCYFYGAVGYLVVFCFICSLSVPYSLASLQRVRMSDEIKSRDDE